MCGHNLNEFRILLVMAKEKPTKDVVLKLRISSELKERVEKEAQQRGITVSELIRKRLVRKPYVRRKGGEESLRRDRTGGDATGSA